MDLPVSGTFFMNAMSTMGLLETGKYFVVMMSSIESDAANYFGFNVNRGSVSTFQSFCWVLNIFQFDFSVKFKKRKPKCLCELAPRGQKIRGHPHNSQKMHCKSLTGDNFLNVYWIRIWLLKELLSPVNLSPVNLLLSPVNLLQVQSMVTWIFLTNVSKIGDGKIE